ncbi:MAG: hypothetical protein WCF66_00290 [Pseudolabrys sp.]
MASRESNGNDASLTQPYKREAPKTCRIHYGFEIADPRFQGKIIDTAIRGLNRVGHNEPAFGHRQAPQINAAKLRFPNPAPGG